MTDNREMKCMEFKAQMIFVVQMILILVPGVWFIFAEWNYWNQDETHAPLSIATYMMFVAPIFAVVIQVQALIGLKKIGADQFTISNEQIIFQSISCTFTVLADICTAVAYFTFNAGWITFSFFMLSLLMNGIAFTTLIITLRKLAIL